MRKPKLHTLFGLENSPGLNDVLFGKVSVDEAIHKNVLPNLDIITGGIIPRHQSEVLGSKRMKEFLAQVKKRYEMVLFDSPPLLAVTDAAILATQTDGLVLVAASMEAQVEGLRRVSKYLSDGIPVAVMDCEWITAMRTASTMPAIITVTTEMKVTTAKKRRGYARRGDSWIIFACPLDADAKFHKG